MDPSVAVAGVGLLLGNGLVVLAGVVKVTRWAATRSGQLELQVATSHRDLSSQVSAVRSDLQSRVDASHRDLSTLVGAVQSEVAGLTAQTKAQNSRVTKLEDGVMYKDTYEAVHQQTAEAVRGLDEDVRAMRASLEIHTSEIAALLERTRAQRIARGLPPDHGHGGADSG